MNLAPYLRRPSVVAAIVKPTQHLFFLSHMRAYSSLFGHILGSHPQICGYYEMHIGYHSWKSLIRQKLVFFREENPKTGMRYMFDKVLHDDHYVAPALLDSPRTKTVFALRDPSRAIPSIIALYEKEDPGHEFTDPAFATDYYIGRARSLAAMARGMHRDYCYIDAEAITANTDACLAMLTDWLNLGSPLDSNYTVQPKTSRGKYGDTSDRLRSGSIDHDATKEPARPLPDNLLHRAHTAYRECRETLAQYSARQCLAE